jgi:phenylpropionate dioxygenase-like ring-hydroxylating dioxygenase large terminal subunit
MLNPEENERLTRVGPGTPMGRVFRAYWIPFALSSELPDADGAPIRVRLLGEDLVAFRDTRGQVGLVDAFCPHRRAPMFFGRNEECGLRCVYHGWKFDRDGTCVDMPSEPPDSLFKTKVKIGSYPAWEGAGMIWTYMGDPAGIPAVPDYEFVRAPESHRFVSKTFERANYLQALEGGLDTSHSSFLHNNRMGDTTALRSRDTAPRLEVDRTPYGYTYAGIRRVDDAKNYVRAYQYIMPSIQCRGGTLTERGEREAVPKIDGHIWIPIDDTHTWVFNYMYSYDPEIPIPRENAVAFEAFSGRGPDDLLPGFRLKRNLDNDYQVDRAMQKDRTYTGITGLNTQDFAIQEGMGPVADRSLEHLGTSDRAIIAMRQLLLEATDDVAAGRLPRGSQPASYRGVRPVDGYVSSTAEWREALKGELVARF